MDEPVIIAKTYDLALYLIPQIAKFPRQQKYTLGERLELMVLDFFIPPHRGALCSRKRTPPQAGEPVA